MDGRVELRERERGALDETVDSIEKAICLLQRLHLEVKCLGYLLEEEALLIFLGVLLV